MAVTKGIQSQGTKSQPKQNLRVDFKRLKLGDKDRNEVSGRGEGLWL